MTTLLLTKTAASPPVPPRLEPAIVVCVRCSLQIKALVKSWAKVVCPQRGGPTVELGRDRYVPLGA